VALLPTVLSLHATKTYSSGEGGAVLCRDHALVLRAAHALNFGFRGDRICAAPGINGRMSEYHAAVGLADLDCWPAKAAMFARVIADYEDAFTRHGLIGRLIRASDIASCYVLLACRDQRETRAVRDGLASAHIECRAWYGPGLHAQPYFQADAQTQFPVTEDLCARLVGLPAGPTLPAAQITRIARTVSSLVNR
jgi:dTDP-4-amino-4,6-dideoxygalactose transaminase